MKPNIVLITVDQMRGDCMGALGHPIVETPNLDMMIREGYTFTNAYSATPSCIAARAALLTGLSQRSHGRVGYKDGVTWDYPHTLAGEFTTAGYHTQCVGKMHVYPTRNLMGFHNVILHDGYLHHGRSSKVPYGEHWNSTDDYLPWLRQNLGPDADILDSGLECNSWTSRPWPFAERLHPTNWVVDQSVDFLRRRDPLKPFFLMQSFVRPHSPLDPPQVYFDMYKDVHIPMPPVGDWATTEDTERNGLYTNCCRGNVNPRALIRAKAAYYALITHIDAQIGRFIQILAEQDQLKNTIILFTSDHGDLMGDHHLFRKAYPYQGSISVPFIIYDPGNLLGGKHGVSIDKPVELRDIMPTLLDAAGVKIPSVVEGKSILPLLAGCGEWREYIHGEHYRQGNFLGIRNESNHFIVTGKDKYVWYSQTGKEQYFNLEKDPDELHDLADDNHHSDRIEYLRNLLIKELDGREEGYTDGRSLIVGCKPRQCLSFIDND